MQTKQQLGAAGERRAQEYLSRLGYGFVAANYRTKFGEIDLIMRDGETLVFVEVKTRTGRRQGHPEEAVHYWKLRHTIRAAEAYCVSHNHTGPWRIDVVGIGTRGLQHTKNVTAML